MGHSKSWKKSADHGFKCQRLGAGKFIERIRIATIFAGRKRRKVLILNCNEAEIMFKNIHRTLQRERDEIKDLRAKEKRDGRAPTLDRYLDFYEVLI